MYVLGTSHKDPWYQILTDSDIYQQYSFEVSNAINPIICWYCGYCQLILTILILKLLANT